LHFFLITSLSDRISFSLNLSLDIPARRTAQRRKKGKCLKCFYKECSSKTQNSRIRELVTKPCISSECSSKKCKLKMWKPCFEREFIQKAQVGEVMKLSFLRGILQEWLKKKSWRSKSCNILLYLYSFLLLSALLFSALLYSTLLHSTLLYSILLYSPLLCSSTLLVLDLRNTEVSLLHCPWPSVSCSEMWDARIRGSSLSNRDGLGDCIYASSQEHLRDWQSTCAICR
jgi:hypothetical protein